MTLLKLIEEYLNQYPNSDNLIPLIHLLGEDEVAKILLNRNGQGVKVIDDDTRLDFVTYEYI